MTNLVNDEELLGMFFLQPISDSVMTSIIAEMYTYNREVQEVVECT